MARVHDLAGKSAGSIDKDPHADTDFDRRVDALMQLLMHPKTNLIVVDELRRAVEDVGDRAYFELSYYQRWVHAMRAILVEKGILEEEEIDRRIVEIKEQLSASGHA